MGLRSRHRHFSGGWRGTLSPVGLIDAGEWSGVLRLSSEMLTFWSTKKTTGIFFEVVTCAKMCGLLFFHIFSLTQNGGGGEMSQFNEFWFQTVWNHFKPQSRIGFYVHKLHLWPNLNRVSTSNVLLFLG